MNGENHGSGLFHVPGTRGIEPPARSAVFEHVIELAKAAPSFLVFPDFMHHEAIVTALQQKLLQQEWDIIVPIEHSLVLATVESMLEIGAKFEWPSVLAETLAWIAVDNITVTKTLWERLVKMGVIDKQMLFLTHIATWKSLVGPMTGSTYRSAGTDFFQTWKIKALDFLIAQEAMAELFVKRNNGKKGVMVGPAMSNPPMPIDIINYFIFTEEELLKVSNKPRRIQMEVEPRVPAVLPSSNSTSNVMRIGYIRSTRTQLNDRDVSVSPQGYLPPISSSIRRPFTFLELPAKVQQIIPSFGSDISPEPNSNIVLTGLRSHNRMFSLPQSWLD